MINLKFLHWHKQPPISDTMYHLLINLLFPEISLMLIQTQNSFWVVSFYPLTNNSTLSVNKIFITDLTNIHIYH